MKKYLQACEIGGSIYGKKRTTGKKINLDNKCADKENLMASYNTFYKNQVAALNKIIRRSG